MSTGLTDDLAACIAGWLALRDPAVGSIQVLDPDVCVLAARLATKMLHSRGHDAAALPVGVLHANAAAAALISEQVATDHWPSHAHAKRIKPDSDPADAVDHWPGHLVVVTGTPGVPGGVTKVLDLTAEQFSLPGSTIGPLALDTDPDFPATRRIAAWRLPTTGSIYQLEDARSLLGNTHRACPDWHEGWLACWPDFEATVHDHLEQRRAL